MAAGRHLHRVQRRLHVLDLAELLRGRPRLARRSYKAGDIWGCIGLWYSGQWHSAAADGYIARVKGYMNQQIWNTTSFIERELIRRRPDSVGAAVRS